MPLLSLALAALIAPAQAQGPAIAGFERFYRSEQSRPPGPASIEGGLLLLRELRCAACHVAGGQLARAVGPDPAPRLDRIARRADARWMQSFLGEPHGTAGTVMPDALGRLAEDREVAALDLVHYLTAIDRERFVRAAPDAEAAERGGKLYREIGCTACHGPRTEDDPEDDSTLRPLAALEAKYGHGGLSAFLADPLTHRPSGRMPDFALSEKETSDLAHHLLRAEVAPGAPVRPTIQRVRSGRRHFVELGCHDCHGDPESGRAAPARTRAAALIELRTDSGCLADAAGPHPRYRLDAAQRESILAALAALRAGLDMPDAPTRIARTMERLDCYACHARGARGVERETPVPPSLTAVGDKLTEDWLLAVLTQDARVRPRSRARMPRFGPSNVRHLATDFVLADLDRKRTLLTSGEEETGRKLVGARGHDCLACHVFQGSPAARAQAPDLARVTGRLQRHWFQSFLLEPATRRGAAWHAAAGALPKLLGGSAEAQVAAMWEYLAGGDEARRPDE
ncbi:MAG: c-type cytochrome [bacterium]|nr:c-type cytochrome [bacterium]